MDIIKNIDEALEANKNNPKKVGRHEYHKLKYNTPNPTEEDVAKIKSYEAEILRRNEATSAYFRRLNKLNDNFKVSTPQLKETFLKRFKMLQGVEYNLSEINNLKALIFYFSKDKRFFNLPNVLSNISKPSFDKGLLIVGDYGTGKSASMATLQDIFLNTPYEFNKYSTNKIVDTFESYKDAEARGLYMGRVKSKPAYFDDVKTEKIASNYGLHNLMKTVIEERYNNKVKTFITCNYREGKEKEADVNDALAEFADKYGARVYDRLFEMFNIIQFNGKSYRI